MKKNLITLIIAGVVILAVGYLLGSFVPVKGLSSGSAKMKNDVDTFAFAFGMDFGNYISQTMEQMNMTDEFPRSEERRVGTESIYRWSPCL